ncbi:unnamed protein product, partial [Mesorhabditis belari]|uniref:PH domain-containing protein n=1 Tax=Mesorhabditis belari TaxID=2138241 RepID=A0AAF3J1Z7_9BILA
MDIRKLKEGEVMRFKKQLLGSKWKKNHLILFSDSRLCWYDEKGDRKPAGSVLLKDVVPYICVGLMTDRMPTRRPSLPDGHSVHHLVGIGLDPRAENVHWLLFASDADLEGWFTEIMKTLPKPNPPPQAAQGPPPPGQSQQNGAYAPPGKYPDAPPQAPNTYPSNPPIAAGGYQPQSKNIF